MIKMMNELGEPEAGPGAEVLYSKLMGLYLLGCNSWKTGALWSTLGEEAHLSQV